MWPRDFAVLLGKTELSAEQGGGYLLFGKSIADVVPEDPSQFVRGTVHLSGFLIQPVADTPEATHITYLFQGMCKVCLAAWFKF